MLDAIREFFEQHVAGPDTARDNGPDPLQLATAALLIEMTRMDGDIEQVERDQVVRAIETRFGLDSAATAELLRLAEQEAQQATDYYQFTKLVNQHFTPEQKERLVEYLWQVAYADGELDKYEEHFVRKIAELIYVPHNAFIAAKLRAKEAAG